MRSAPECHLRARPHHYPMLGPASGDPRRRAPTVRRGKADTGGDEGFPHRIVHGGQGKKVLANGSGSVENAGLLGRPRTARCASHRVSGESESKYAPRCISTARNHAEAVGGSRSRVAGEASPEGFLSRTCGNPANEAGHWSWKASIEWRLRNTSRSEALSVERGRTQAGSDSNHRVQGSWSRSLELKEWAEP